MEHAFVCAHLAVSSGRRLRLTAGTFAEYGQAAIERSRTRPGLRDGLYPMRLRRSWTVTTVANDIADALAMPDLTYRRLLEMIPMPIAIFSGAGAVFVNTAACVLMEAESAQELLGLPPTAFVHPLDSAIVENRMRKLEEGALLNAPVALRLLTRRGRLRRIMTSSARITVGGQLLIAVISTDDTMRYEAEDRLKENEENFQRLFESTQDVYYRTDADGVVLKVAPAVRRVLGYEPEEIVGRRAEDYYPSPSEREPLKKALREHGKVQDFEGRMVRRDGVIIDISISSYALYGPTGQFLGVEGIYRDISDRKNLERELRRLATSDSLTGIANRRAFLEQASDCLRRAARYEKDVVLFIADLDHFKMVNDRYGHVAGDGVLQAFAAAVAPELRDTDFFGRLGGEEFGILLHEVRRKEAQHVAERIGESARSLRFAAADGQQYGITVSIGATRNHRDDRGIERLLARADMALYAAKEAGRDCIRWSEP
jgi:diguanylate cyclase (GGDEF)-like protein/PAS domain S-box-containing protein